MTTLTKDEQKEKLFEIVSDFSDRINGALEEDYGLNEWFSAFVGSDTFATLDPVEKSNAFDDFYKLHSRLKKIAELNIKQIY
jgi:hypothetical protein